MKYKTKKKNKKNFTSKTADVASKKYYLFHFYSCQGCDPHVYGSSCNKSCPINCKNMCHIQYGACFACMTGWSGTFCNKSKDS